MTDDNSHYSQECYASSSQQGRRDFLKAAAGSAGWRWQLRRYSVPRHKATKAKPSFDTPMPHIMLGKYSISRLIVGCHNIEVGSTYRPSWTTRCTTITRRSGP